jgi:hypothetical protein
MYFMSILEDGCPNYGIGRNTTDRLNSIPLRETKHVSALRSNSKANIDTKIKCTIDKDLINSNIVLFLSNKILYFRALVKQFQNNIYFIDNYVNFVKS